jgi:hypothetical protein
MAISIVIRVRDQNPQIPQSQCPDPYLGCRPENIGFWTFLLPPIVYRKRPHKGGAAPKSGAAVAARPVPGSCAGTARPRRFLPGRRAGTVGRNRPTEAVPARPSGRNRPVDLQEPLGRPGRNRVPFRRFLPGSRRREPRARRRCGRNRPAPAGHDQGRHAPRVIYIYIYILWSKPVLWSTWGGEYFGGAVLWT